MTDVTNEPGNANRQALALRDHLDRGDGTPSILKIGGSVDVILADLMRELWPSIATDRKDELLPKGSDTDDDIPTDSDGKKNANALLRRAGGR